MQYLVNSLKQTALVMAGGILFLSGLFLFMFSCLYVNFKFGGAICLLTAFFEAALVVFVINLIGQIREKS